MHGILLYVFSWVEVEGRVENQSRGALIWDHALNQGHSDIFFLILKVAATTADCNVIEKELETLQSQKKTRNMQMQR